MTADELADAIRTLAICDHFDESRRAARTLPDTITTLELQHAADGCARIARALTIHRRTAA